MLISAVSVLVVAQSSSEIPEGRMNNPVYWNIFRNTAPKWNISKFQTCDWFVRINYLFLEFMELGRPSSWHVVSDIGTPIGTESEEFNGRENIINGMSTEEALCGSGYLRRDWTD